MYKFQHESKERATNHPLFIGIEGKIKLENLTNVTTKYCRTVSEICSEIEHGAVCIIQEELLHFVRSNGELLGLSINLLIHDHEWDPSFLGIPSVTDTEFALRANSRLKEEEDASSESHDG